MELKKGIFYNTLTEKRGDSDALKACMEGTVLDLLESDTNTKKPGVLLGKIQSGKTRAFIGIIALAFDNDYDVAIVLTKGTTALSEQTTQRLKELEGGLGLFEEKNQIQIHDIMSFPDNLPKFVLSQKLVLVSKKEDDNLKRVLKNISEIYPSLQDKKTLIIDDEADFASISFQKEKDTGLVKQRTIARQIDDIRSKINQSDFLQVTATPYSLFLQPDDNDGSDGIFLPQRPAFTRILPTYSAYIGGKYYFIDSEDNESAASHVYEELPISELEILAVKKTLGRADRRSLKIEDVFISDHTRTLRKSIVNFIVGGCIRRLQQKQSGYPMEHYSMVIHTDIHNVSHSWQEEIVKKLNEELIIISKDNKDLFRKLIEEAYNDLRSSIDIDGFYIPKLDTVLESVSESLKNGMLFVQTVNAKGDIKSLLDAKGQLKLWAPLNIFIGGQILDRGITIKNMIGFFYGRNPGRFQQDTVLQHSRMYGARSKEDLSVTRFYTTRNIYETMRQINEFDEALRQEIERMIESGSTNGLVYFLRKDASGKLVPCSPNKLMLSKITTLKPYKRLLPIGFQTDFKSNIGDNIKRLDDKISELNPERSDYCMITIEQALDLIDEIEKTLIFEEDGYEWDVKTHKSCLEHLSANSLNPEQKGKVWMLIRTNRNISRIKPTGGFSDQPDNPETDHPTAKKYAIDTPVLMLFRQNGDKENLWRGSPFWWPVIMTPLNTYTTIFASETMNSNQ